MAGPFDTYDIQFSQPLSKVDTNFYTQALFKKKEAYDEGFQQAQSFVDNIAGLPVGNEAGKKHLQEQVDNLSSQINSLNPDFSDMRTLTNIRSMSRQLAGDSKIQSIITSAANLKSANERYLKIKEKGGEEYQPANEWLYLESVNKFKNATDASEAFNSEYIAGFDTFKYAVDRFNSINPDEKIVETDSGYVYQTKTGTKAVDKNTVSTMLQGLLKEDNRLQRQLGIEARYEYRDYTPEELGNVMSTYSSSFKDQTIKQAESMYAEAFARKEGSDERQQYLDAAESYTNRYGDLIKQEEAFKEKIKKGDTEGLKNWLKKNHWTSNVVNMIVGKAGTYESNTLSESISGKLNREAQKEINRAESRGNQSKTEGVELGVGVPFGVNTETQQANTYSQLSSNLERTVGDRTKARNEYFYKYMPGQFTSKYFNTPEEQTAPDGTPLPMSYTLKPEKQEEFEKHVNNLRAAYSKGDPSLTTEIRQYFQWEEKQNKIIQAQAEAKVEADKAAENTLNKSANYQALNKLEIPTSYIPYNGKNVKVDKNAVIKYAKVMSEMAPFLSVESAYNFVFRDFFGLTTSSRGKDLITGKKYDGSLEGREGTRELLEKTAEKHGISLDTLFAIESSPFSTVAVSVYKHLKPALEESDKIKDNSLRKYQDAINLQEFPILFGKEESSATNLANLVSTAYAAVNEKGDADYSKAGELLKNYAGEKFKALNLTYSEPDGKPTITISEPGSKERHPIPLDKKTAEDLKFLSKSNPLNQDLELLRWRRKPGTNMSNTADGFKDAPELDVLTVGNTVTQLKYKIDQRDNAYFLTVYEKPIKINGENSDGKDFIIDESIKYKLSSVPFYTPSQIAEALNGAKQFVAAKYSQQTTQQQQSTNILQDFQQ